MNLKIILIVISILFPATTSNAPIVVKDILVEDSGTIREVSAYNSVKDQTDGNPCEAADQSDICARYKAGECLVAANFVPLGTKLHIDGFGDCSVADRMNRRYANSVDIFMDKDIDRAIDFGRQKLLVKIIK